MEAEKQKTVDDLQAALLEDERLELINGHIIKRAMARFEHGAVQSEVVTELAQYRRNNGADGWWIATEISVRYNEHHCPTHDLAGWRKKHLPNRPHGVMDTIPDWVCEITSPGHEKKDLLDNLLLLQKYQVPYYWIISPEDQTLIAYKLMDGKYQLIETLNHDLKKVRIEPFKDVEFDMRFIFGEGDE